MKEDLKFFLSLLGVCVVLWVALVAFCITHF